jgi:hypothetical protein
VNNNTERPLVPIYTTRGDVEAYLAYPNIYNLLGEWVGWVKSDRKVYSVHGHYAGWLNKDPRILRKLADGYGETKIEIPKPSSLTIPIPPTAPLAPLMAELTFGVIDVLLDAPDLLPPIDFGELREDMD